MNDLNGAKRLNVWNGWNDCNGSNCDPALNLEPVCQAQGRLETLELLNHREALNALNVLNFNAVCGQSESRLRHHAGVS